MPKPPDQPMPPNEFGKLVSYLARQGFSPGQIFEAIGNKPGGRDRSVICAALREYLRNPGEW